ncbi:GMC family oxidoreductase [Halomonas dongshanensis]|uniref:GMC family oxidoreductase N-terminal domain-containing protein n=1 Tax=Halomonas dongshanensis TaxID=2890835 RepID=A0ABT2ECC3_9GAMM|nr:GMC family oxidoreductase N-terminal domain-containing protein [Halomonas dongshanensis]MCS2609220.1 GMC family oxidoreductase N-terminal domain-containing protein [Halomonas dongshanensis]
MKNKKKRKYDYIVVGSGAAGGIVSCRLSEQHPDSVCLLEAGSSNWHPYLNIPAGFIKVIFKPGFAWQFSTEANALTLDRNIPIPQGRVLGGSTSINGLVYNRGLKSDYDNWSALGNEGWDYKSVLPYFNKCERRIGHAKNETRGFDGLISVTDSNWPDAVCDAFIEGASEFGISKNPDYNGTSQEGVGYFQRTIFSGKRVSTANTYIKRAKKQFGLIVMTHSQVTKVLFDGNRAIGVEFFNSKSGSIENIYANKEVILSAGAINTPKILNLSGIGGIKDLEKFNITPVADLPGVGKNLKDHYSIRISNKIENAVTINERAKGPRLALEVLKWIVKKPSILSLSPSVVHIFCRSNKEVQEPDLQGVFSPASYRNGYVGVLDKYPGMTCGFWQHRPKSTGEVKLVSDDPFDAPAVQPNYLQHEEDQEKIILCAKLARKMMSSDALAPYNPTETFPGSKCQTDQQILDFCRRYGVSSYHLCGTAKMGPSNDSMAVVDSRLRVKGITSLRIVDASVMPDIPSANICAATMMIAEKASDMILEDSKRKITV